MASIGMRHFDLLRIVDTVEGKSQQVFAAVLRVSPSRMVTLVDDLEGRGLLERRRDPADRRAWALYLTAMGRSLLERAMKGTIQDETSLTVSLGPTEREQLRDLLHRIAGEQGLPVARRYA